MKKALIHTPEGVRDIYGQECKRKLNIEDKLHHVLQLYHYQDIETPSFEFFDIFNQEKGSVASNEMYKLFDSENNTMVLRPDMTPSIARCVAKCFEEENNHIRLCYKGKTFVNGSRYQGKLRENTHLGAELIGDDTSAADGEIISLVVDCLLATGLKEFQVSIGQVEYFKGIVEEAGFDEETESKLRVAIQNKNAFAIEQIVNDSNISENLKQALCNLTNILGGADVLEEAKKLVHNERSLKAIDRLEKLYKIMTYYGYEKYISFDLGMLSRYEYYTGVIFKGYTYGTGDAIVQGGRYNNLLKQFGKDAPSIGFAFVIDQLMLALGSQNIEEDEAKEGVMILYAPEKQEKAIAMAKEYRQKEISAQLTRKSSRKTVEEYKAYMEEQNFVKMIVLSNDGLTEYNNEGGKA